MKTRITIMGRPCSKKNNRRNFRKVSLPSEAYEKFKENALPQLEGVKESVGEAFFGKPLNVDYTFYQKGRLTQDGDNAEGSINDILQDAGIIDNDKNIKQHSSFIVDGCKDWATIIVIEDLPNYEHVSKIVRYMSQNDLFIEVGKGRR